MLQLRAVVLGQSIPIDHPRGNGNWWSLSTLYLQSLLHDPFILARMGHTPTVVLPGDPPPGDLAHALLFYAQPSIEGDEKWVYQTLEAGGTVVLNRPDPAMLQSLSAYWPARSPAGRSIESLRERWDIGSRRDYYYADQEKYDRHDPAAGKILSWIGEHPDLIVRDRLSLFAGNPWPTIFRYLNTPRFPHLLLDVATLLARLVAVVQQCDVPSDNLLESHVELRRDFHAFGFAAFTVEQLEACYADSKIDLNEAKSLAIQAAGKLIAGDGNSSQTLLRRAFQALERENRKTQPQPAIFTDTLHAGGLFDDIGFCEFDWPQHAADALHCHLDWAEHRGYRFNLDFAAQSLDELCTRFPRLEQRLRIARENGWVELVNGSWNQPYPPFFTLQSILRQFDLGTEDMRERFGTVPTHFASQEFAFSPQFAAILSQYDYQGVVLRVQNMGDAPTSLHPLVRWTAPSGESVPTLPSHTYKSEHRNEVTYNNLHLKLFAAREAGNPSPLVFTGLGDVTYYRPFREELARSLYYANVFGRFSTWRDFFSPSSSSDSLAALKTSMEDFDCRACFLEVDRWPHLRSTAGGSIDHCMRSLAASELFRAAELLDVLIPVKNVENTDSARQNWRSLAAFQGHDRYFSPNFPSGTFMGGSTGPTSSNGRSVQTVSDYCGVWDATTIGKRYDRDLSAREQQARLQIDRRLEDLGMKGVDGPAWAIFNSGASSTRIVRFENMAGRKLVLNGQALPAQDDGNDRLAAVYVPAYSCITICPASSEHRNKTSPIPPPVRCGDTFLENGYLRVEFDPKTGVIQRLLGGDGYHHLLLAGGNRFSAPGSGDQVCTKLNWHQRTPLLASVEFELAISMPAGQPCLIRSCLSLEAGQRYLELKQSIETCPPINGDQWNSHLGLRFDLPDEDFELQRSHYNVLEAARDSRIFSPNLLLAQKGNQYISLLNRGNQFYVRNGRTISGILICENEPARSFSHAVGYPQSNPLIEARAWAAPWFIARLPAGSDAEQRSVVDIDSENIELLSITRQQDGLTLRMANLAGMETQSEVRFAVAIAAARICKLNGRQVEQLQVHDRRVKMTFRPWGIVQLEVEIGEGADGQI